MDDTTCESGRLREVLEKWWRTNGDERTDAQGFEDARQAAAECLGRQESPAEPSIVELLQRFENHARAVLADTENPALAAGRHAELRTCARWLRRAASGDSAADPSVALLSEVEGLR